MSAKNSLRWAAVLAFLMVLLAAPKPAMAWSGCGSSYVVQWGDTLGSVAAACDTSVDALRQANPGVGYWIYAGQTLTIPDGYQNGGYGYNYGFQGAWDGGYGHDGGYQNPADCYTHQDGSDHYGGQYGSNCYGSGFPAYTSTTSNTYRVRSGDTMRIIAERFGIPLPSLIAANPQIWNPDLIYVGQVICLPSFVAPPPYYQPAKYGGQPGYHDGSWDGHHGHYQQPNNLYTIQHGDSLKEIAKLYDTTVEDILKLNPVLLGNAKRIHAGQVIQVY